MKITIRYFAQLREDKKTETEIVTVNSGSLVEDVFDLLFPNTEECHRAERYLRAAINDEYVTLKSPLNEGDELALLPPVAGG